MLYSGVHTDSKKVDVRMCLSKDTEDFISKGLSDHFHTLKVKEDDFESINTGEKTFRLGA